MDYRPKAAASVWLVSAIRILSVKIRAKFSVIGYNGELALVAIYRERPPNWDGEFMKATQIVAVSRYVIDPDLTTCTFPLAIADEFNGPRPALRMMLRSWISHAAKGWRKLSAWCSPIMHRC